MENEMISKELEAALKDFQTKTNQVPEGYFDQFEQDLMRKIQAEKNTPKKATLFFIGRPTKQYLVAASLLFAIVAGALLFDKSSNEASIRKEALVQIEALPDETIEIYVNENELVAEVDYTTAIETLETSVQLNNN
jgi:hypothetical protein